MIYNDMQYQIAIMTASVGAESPSWASVARNGCVSEAEFPQLLKSVTTQLPIS